MPNRVRILLVKVVACLLLCACVKEETLYPSGAVQEIMLLKNGQGRLHYKGTFRDAFPELETFLQTAFPDDKLDDGEGDVTEAEMKRRVLRAFGTVSNLHIEPKQQGVYAIDYEVDFAWDDEIPDLLDPQGPLAKRWVSLVAFEHKRQEKIMRAVAQDEYKEIQELLVGERKRVGSTPDVDVRPLLPLLGKLRGELVIRTDGIVDRHNADSVRKKDNGINEYRWKIDGNSLYATEFHVGFDRSLLDHERASEAKSAADCAAVAAPDMRALCLVRTAKPGTSCQSLIGQNCKCGPFAMRGFNGMPLANARYTIIHAEGETEGCSDERGYTEAVDVLRTGPCKLAYEHKKCDPAGKR